MSEFDKKDGQGETVLDDFDKGVMEDTAEDMADEEFDSEIYILTDENNKEEEFELLARLEDNGNEYVALSPLSSKNEEIVDYVILKVEVDENGEEGVVTISDDDEFERIEDMFDELFASEDFDEE